MPRMALRITSPGDPGWDTERATFNLLDDQRPAAVAVAQDPDDVVAAVRHAAERGLTDRAAAHRSRRVGDGARR